NNGAGGQRLRAERTIGARRNVATNVRAAAKSAINVNIALGYVVKHARGCQASTRRLVDGVAATGLGGGELTLGDGIVRRVRIAHLGQTPIFIHQGLDGGHRRRSDRGSAKTAPGTRRTGAGSSAVAGVGPADGDVVPPEAVRGKERNVRNIAHSVGRVAEDAGLPRGLGIPRARPVNLEKAGLVGSSSPGGAGTRAAPARAGAQVVCRTRGAVAEARGAVCCERAGDVVGDQDAGAGIVPGNFGNVRLCRAVGPGVARVPVSAEGNGGTCLGCVVHVLEVCAAHRHVVGCFTPARDADTREFVIAPIREVRGASGRAPIACS